MAGVNQVFSLADDLARYLIAYGKTSVLQTKPINPRQLKGLRLAENVIGDTFSTTNSVYITKLQEVGYSKENIMKLLKYNYSLDDILSLSKEEVLSCLFSESDSIRIAREISKGIKPRYTNVFEYMPEYMQDVQLMDLSHKIRSIDLYKKGKIKSHLSLTSKEISEVNALNTGFTQMPSIGSNFVLYRGESYYNHNPQLKILQNLKEGETFKMSGYPWLTDASNYAFGYGEATLNSKTSVVYRILLSPESKVAVSKSCKGQEFFMNNDENFKLVEKIFEPDVNKLYLFLEHLPTL